MIRKILCPSIIILNIFGVAVLNAKQYKEEDKPDWGKLAEKNSHYEIVTDIDEKSQVWALTQARIFNNNSKILGIGGFMGTAWIIRINHNHVVFVTAAHVLKNAFYSKDDPDDILVFLWAFHKYAYIFGLSINNSVCL